MNAINQRNASRVELRRAYYSLLQFCPDSARDERVNIAVVLEAPQHAYQSAKYLRHMDKIIRCLDPSIDAKLVRIVAQELEYELKSKDPGRVLDTHALFEEAEQPSRLHLLREIFNSPTRSMWRLTEPKPLFVPDWQRFEDRLNLLYNRLVERPGEVTKEVWDKGYVRSRTVIALEKRKIILDLGPDPLQGSFYQENEFDAAYKKEKNTFFQFFSYDIENPDMGQLKVFLTSVEDLLRGQHYTPENGYYYTAIVQPPKHHIDRESRRTFESAVEYLRKKDIATFATEEAHMDRVAQALHEGQNPRDYQLQL
jgi:hypothetical protein